MGDARSALVTGCSSGFGALIARTLVDHGDTVFATMREVEGRNASKARALREWADGRKGELHVLDLDVTDGVSVKGAVEKALETAGHVDVVVNNAGLGAGGFAEASTADQLRQILEVNVVGVHRLNRAVLPSMRKSGSGLLIHISSVMGRIVLPFAAAYTASKFALEGLAESYRYELSGTGVDVVVLEPGGFGTDFFRNMVKPDDPDRIASYGPIAEVPGKIWGGIGARLKGEDAPDPQDVADAVVELIQTPAGQRPLRTVVDPMSGGEGPKAINSLTADVQKQLLEGFGMGELLSVRSSS